MILGLTVSRGSLLHLSMSLGVLGLENVEDTCIRGAPDKPGRASL